MLLSEAIDALCIAIRAEGRSPRTVQSYREKLGHLVAFLGDLEHRRALVTEKRGKPRFVFFQEPTARVLAAWLEVRPENTGHGSSWA